MINQHAYKSVVARILIVAIFIFVSFSSFYNLSESPVTWTDEGLIIQTSQNLSEQGIYGFQIAPKDIISPSFISTSYPVTYPISLSFSLFGVSLFNARAVMAIYIILLVASIFFLLKTKTQEELIWALLLVGTFPPLYGHGKNVLGEVPGLFWVLLSAWFLVRLEEKKENVWNWVLFGLSLGLALVTKPIFILVVPGAAFVLWLVYRSDDSRKFKNYVALLVSLLLPLVLWFFVQFFENDGLKAVIKYYSNPHSVNILQAIVTNLRDFVSNPRTLFAGGSFSAWTLSLLYLKYKGKKIDLFEIYLYALSLLVFVLYFRNPPYYRYFFIPEILSLVFLSFSLFRLSFDNVFAKSITRLLLVLIVVFQLYQLNFNSWVADSYSSHRTEVMSEIIGEVPQDRTVFFYQAPEAVVFLKHFNYYQYFSGTVATQFGEENLDMIKGRDDLLIITRKDLLSSEFELFSDYQVLKEFDRYVLLDK